MTILPIRLMHHYCSLFPPLPSPWWTLNDQASSTCNAKWPCPRAWCAHVGGGWDVPTGQLAFLLGSQIIIHSTQHSVNRSPGPETPLASTQSPTLAGTPPPWGRSWPSSHTGRFKSHVVYRKKRVCSLSIDCFILVFTEFGSRHTYISADSF